DLYLHSGIAHHWSSEVQSSSTETVVSIKAYYTFNWPTQWRFGVAEGMSYIDNITYIEKSEMERKGYTPSHLLNYLDFSFDVNVGDLVGKNDWKNVWFGYSLHHRSAIFEKASQFGRIKGGSNYNTVYLQFDF
ncbi:MltA-interacting MipA family protein, partial [Vibrio vulnificus]